MLPSRLMFTKSLTVSVAVSNVGVVFIRHESRWTVLQGYLLSQQMVDAVKRVVQDNQQDSAPVHLAFSTVQLLWCKTLNFLFPALRVTA